MASHITIARPYAKALFEYASEHNQVDAWLAALSVLAITVGQGDVQQMLKNPEQSQQDMVELLKDVARAVIAAELSSLGDGFVNFLSLLAENKRLNILPDISRAFHLYHAEQTGMVEADVVSAYVLTDAQRASLQQKLEQRFNTKVELNFSEDASLMGGMIITAGNWVMDGSIKSKIERLNEGLTT